MIAIYDDVELQKIANKCKAKIEFAFELGYKYYNGRIISKINDLILKYKIDISHFDSSYKNKERKKYKIIAKNCPVCNLSFTVKKGHKKEKTTCSNSCANTYFYEKRYNVFINNMRSKTLTIHKLHNKKCKNCNKEFKTKKKKQMCCSRRCSSSENWKNKKFRENIVNKAVERVKNGTHKGWQSRDKINKSFPEKYTIKILEQLKIEYQSEYKVGKWFVDFADVKRKIAFEVDGKQHDLPDRKKSDQIKDEFLIKNGWTVKRYKWKRISTIDDRNNYISIIKSIFL